MSKRCCNRVSPRSPRSPDPSRSRRQRPRSPLRRRGDLRPDVDPTVATEMLVGPVYWRLLFGGELDAPFAEVIVDEVLQGWSMRGWGEVATNQSKADALAERLEAVEGVVAGTDSPVVVIGSLGATRFAAGMRSLMGSTGEFVASPHGTVKFRTLSGFL